MSHRTDPPDITVRHGAYLPHWTRERATYAVTFRLADSLPKNVLEDWVREREEIVAVAAKQGRPLSVSEERRLRTLRADKVETYLDVGNGACLLRDPRVAAMVCDALRYFDGVRYRMHAGCVMPNHVHAVVEPFAAHTLASILHSWKTFTARKANQTLLREGEFWQPEYYDHLIRDQEELGHAVRYCEENPAKAGLNDWPWVYVARTSRP